MTAECDDRLLLGSGERHGVKGLWPNFQILNHRPLAPFCHRFRIASNLSAQCRQRACDSCNSYGMRGHGSPVTNWSHTASSLSHERISLSNRGIRHLAFAAITLLLASTFWCATVSQPNSDRPLMGACDGAEVRRLS